MKTGRRKLAAIMFTDIVGYSSMMMEDEQHGRDQRKLHREIFDALTTAHQGQVIQYYGDGTLSIFDSAVAAAECAVAMQKQWIKAGIPVRIGIHLGDIHHDDTEVYGHGVNMASRIEPLCHPGGILVSDKIYDEIKNHDHLPTQPLGIFEFQKTGENTGLHALTCKGLPLPTAADIDRMQRKAQQVTMAEPQAAISTLQRFRQHARQWRQRKNITRSTAVAALAGLILLVFAANPFERSLPTVDVNHPPSVAVIPFENLSDLPDNEYFSDGITEDMLTLLSKIEGLGVTSRTSVMRYKGSDKSTQRMARELGVTHLLVGSVRRENNRVRINAQLIDARQDQQIWANTYDEELTSIFDVQSRVASDIAGQLQRELPLDDGRYAWRQPTEDVEAYNWYLKGREQYRRYQPEANDTAIEYFQRALDRDSSYARAWAGLGDALAQKSKGASEEGVLEAAIQVSTRAIALDSSLSEGYKSLGLAYQYQGEDEAALAAYNKALERDPANDMASHNVGTIYRKRGDFVRSIEWAERTMQINRNIPETIEHLAHLYREIGDVATSKSLIHQGKQLDDAYPDFYAQESELALLTGDLKEAELEAKNYLKLGADTVRAHTLMGQVYLCQGNWQEAKHAFADALTYLPTKGCMESLSLQALASLADYQAGDTESARNTWKEILKKIDDEDMSSDPKQKQKVCLISSGILAQTGKVEAAIRCLQETPDLLPSAGILQVHPFFRDLKDEPAFQSLLDSLQHTADSIKVLVKSSDFRPQT